MSGSLHLAHTFKYKRFLNPKLCLWVEKARPQSNNMVKDLIKCQCQNKISYILVGSPSTESLDYCMMYTWVGTKFRYFSGQN